MYNGAEKANNLKIYRLPFKLTETADQTKCAVFGFYGTLTPFCLVGKNMISVYEEGVGEFHPKLHLFIWGSKDYFILAKTVTLLKGQKRKFIAKQWVGKYGSTHPQILDKCCILSRSYSAAHKYNSLWKAIPGRVSRINTEERTFDVNIGPTESYKHIPISHFRPWVWE